MGHPEFLRATCASASLLTVKYSFLISNLNTPFVWSHSPLSVPSPSTALLVAPLGTGRGFRSPQSLLSSKLSSPSSLSSLHAEVHWFLTKPLLWAPSLMPRCPTSHSVMKSERNPSSYLNQGMFSSSEHFQPQQITKSLVPSWNTLVFFEVSPVSFHQARSCLLLIFRSSLLWLFTLCVITVLMGRGKNCG